MTSSKKSPITMTTFPVAGSSTFENIINKALRAFAVWCVFAATIGLASSHLLEYFLAKEVHPWVDVVLVCVTWNRGQSRLLSDSRVIICSSVDLVREESSPVCK